MNMQEAVYSYSQWITNDLGYGLILFKWLINQVTNFSHSISTQIDRPFTDEMWVCVCEPESRHNLYFGGDSLWITHGLQTLIFFMFFILSNLISHHQAVVDIVIVFIFYFSVLQYYVSRSAYWHWVSLALLNI